MNNHDQQWDDHDPDLTADNGQLDFNALRADDEFLNALSRDAPVLTGDDTEYQLAVLLSGWRHESLSQPLPPLPTVDEIEHAIAASEPPRRGRRAMRHLRVVSGAAAVAVVAAAGLIVVSEGAQPGDTLWGVKSVVFAEQAQQTKAMVQAKDNLEQAQSAVQTGDLSSANSLISQASEDLKPVKDEETRRRMNEWIERLKDDSAEKATSSSKASKRSKHKSTSAGPTGETTVTNDPGTTDTDPGDGNGTTVSESDKPDRSQTVLLSPPSTPPSSSAPPTRTVPPTTTASKTTVEPTTPPTTPAPTEVETTSPSS